MKKLYGVLFACVAAIGMSGVVNAKSDGISAADKPFWMRC